MNQYHFETFFQAQCEYLAQLCRLTSQSSDILLRQGKVERKNDNFNRASRLFTKSKSMLKRDPKGRWVDGDTMFKVGFQIDALDWGQSELKMKTR